MNRRAAGNRRLAQWRMTWLIEHSTSHQLWWCIDPPQADAPKSATAPSAKTLVASVTDTENRQQQTTETMKKIVLISCVSKKGNRKTKAKDLYESPLFAKSLAYGQKLNPDNIYILSAQHHLLDLDTEIEPYDRTLNKMSKNDRTNWGKRVIEHVLTP